MMETTIIMAAESIKASVYLKLGQGVHYVPDRIKDEYSRLITLTEAEKAEVLKHVENGVIKSYCEGDFEHVFVVYHCGGEWDNYQNYTAAKTHVRDLFDGWWTHVIGTWESSSVNF